MATTAFALFLAVPLWAQHGGGHGGGGGGHAGGFGGGHSGGFSGHAGFSGGHAAAPGVGVHAFSGPRSQASTRSFSPPSSRFSSTRSFSARAGLSRGPFLHDGFRGPGFRSGFRNSGFRNNCFGFPCRVGYGWPWAYAGYWDPWWWWNSDSDYDPDYNDNLALAQQMNEQNLEEQQMFQQEEADGDQDAYARPQGHSANRDSASDEKQGASIFPATVLVFRDNHKQEVANYAIVGNALWAFAPQHTQRIPLSDLDLTATAEANDDRGVAFRIPAARHAQ